jgi:hypothetical protein
VSRHLAKSSERSKKIGDETEENDMEPTMKTIELPPLSSTPNHVGGGDSAQHHLDHLQRWWLIQVGNTIEIHLREQQERGKEQSHKSAECRLSALK